MSSTKCLQGVRLTADSPEPEHLGPSSLAVFGRLKPHFLDLQAFVLIVDLPVTHVANVVDVASVGNEANVHNVVNVLFQEV